MERERVNEGRRFVVGELNSDSGPDRDHIMVNKRLLEKLEMTFGSVEIENGILHVVRKVLKAARNEYPYYLGDEVS